MEAKVEQKVLRAPAISCGHCVMSIQRAVKSLDGVAGVEGDPGAKTVTVSYDPAKISLAKIEEAMAAEGYPVAK